MRMRATDRRSSHGGDAEAYGDVEQRQLLQQAQPPQTLLHAAKPPGKAADRQTVDGATRRQGRQETGILGEFEE